MRGPLALDKAAKNDSEPAIEAQINTFKHRGGTYSLPDTISSILALVSISWLTW